MYAEKTEHNRMVEILDSLAVQWDKEVKCGVL